MNKIKPFSITRRLMSMAYQKIRSNKGAGEVDALSQQAFHANYKDHLYRIWNQLSSGTYIPPPVRLKEIPKKGARPRPLDIPTVADRIVQTIVRDLLEPSLELIFHKDSYGHRPGRSAIDALSRARERCLELNWVVDVDIKGYLDDIPHDLLMKAVKQHCQVKWILLCIERWLKAPLQKEGWDVGGSDKGGSSGIDNRTFASQSLFSLLHGQMA